MEKWYLDDVEQQKERAAGSLLVCCYSAYVPNHGDLFCHVIDQSIRLNLAVKGSLRILRDSLRSLRTL